MRQLLELISEAPAIVEETGGIYGEGEAPADIGHVVLRVETAGWATEADLLRIVRAELPASVTFELFVGDRRIWPPTRAPRAGPRSRGEPGGRRRTGGVEWLTSPRTWAAPRRSPERLRGARTEREVHRWLTSCAPSAGW